MGKVGEKGEPHPSKVKRNLCKAESCELGFWGREVFVSISLL